MGRARGSDATLQLAYEATYGTPPGSGYHSLPFVSTSLGATRGLIESELLGQGRAPLDPTPDVINNDGDVVVPVDPSFFGYWLTLLLGEPATAPVDDTFSHFFGSGAAVLPSASIPIGHPRVPSYSVNYGVRANTLQINATRGGLLNATVGLIGKGETTPGPTTTIPPAGGLGTYNRFAQASGGANADGVQLASLVSGTINYSNGLDKIETIRPDSEIEDVDPGMPTAGGNVTLRFADHALLNKAIGGIPISLEFMWSYLNSSLTLTMDRVFLPRPKRSITGPGGIMASFDYQASTGANPMLRATLGRTSIASFTA
ncbi:phage tail tube protein [Sphingomonas dokdonensis]|uniref:Uncharacterized protein n=1 Tax=Sphingomonas dokdonensis TaxID=344880 RepID=A0A245ZHI8_9SPHN|nr:phage tail tube protein [Sphingomonas dokdonensis]OWK29209.1 hypothetical protein SPDO_21900 [Sphingomonas dokdonensis]